MLTLSVTDKLTKANTDHSQVILNSNCCSDSNILAYINVPHYTQSQSEDDRKCLVRAQHFPASGRIYTEALDIMHCQSTGWNVVLLSRQVAETVMEWDWET